MNAALPSDLLNLKARFESWRRTRTKKGPIPDHLRQAAIALLDRYSATTICEVCRLHPRTLHEPVISNCARKTPVTTAPDFFPLPALAQADLSFSTAQAQADCKLLLERPDGARLTLTLPTIDAETDRVFLILFGTGVRFQSSPSMVRGTLGDANAQAAYAGAQGDFVGLDQINLLAPRSLMGRGETDVRVKWMERRPIPSKSISAKLARLEL